MYIHKNLKREDLTPDLALDLLKEGNSRFVNNLKTNRNLLQQVNETRDGQNPFATILSCMDSRTSAELIFDQGLGDIFSIRVAGNILNDDIVGSMEFATKVIGTKIIVVLGHSKCGAIVGACDNVKLGHLSQLLDKIQPAINQEKTITTERHGKNQAFVEKVTYNNVINVTQEIRRKSEIILQLEREGAIKIFAGIYDVETGQVLFS